MKVLRVVLLLLVRIFPSTRCFWLKRGLLRLAGLEIGENVRIVSSVRFLNGGKVSIGENTWLGHEVMLVGGQAGIVIGRDCDIAPRVTFLTGTHAVLLQKEKAAGPGYSLPITVHDGCWICAGATVLAGSEIGSCSIVAAGSVVKGKFPPRVLIGGVPARVISELA